MTREPCNERIINVCLDGFRTKDSLLNAAPHGEFGVKEFEKRLSSRYLKELAVPVAEAELDCGWINFNQKCRQDVLNEGSPQHRDRVGVDVTGQYKVTVGVEGFRLERIARVVVAWVQHTIVVCAALVVE